MAVVVGGGRSQILGTGDTRSHSIVREHLLYTLTRCTCREHILTDPTNRRRKIALLVSRDSLKYIFTTHMYTHIDRTHRSPEQETQDRIISVS